MAMSGIGHKWNIRLLIILFGTCYFVPDSPTASLFFTLSIGFLLMDRSLNQQPNKSLSSYSRVCRSIRIDYFI